MLQRLVLLAGALLVVACVGAAKQELQEPVVITDVGESENFPILAAGYSRGSFTKYTNGTSVAYNTIELTLANAVTIYFYAGLPDPAKQFDAEKKTILASHKDAGLTNEQVTTFSRDGVDYIAHIATYQLPGTGSAGLNDLFSELILISLPSGYMKVRSSAPLAHSSAAQAGVRQLLEAVNWTVGRAYD